MSRREHFVLKWGLPVRNWRTGEAASARSKFLDVEMPDAERVTPRYS